MSSELLSSWEEVDPPGWRRLVATNVGVIEQLEKVSRLNGKQR
jgi:hypothetical protein